VDLLDARKGLTVIAATHNLSIAEELGNRALLLASGRPGVLFDGSPSALLRDQGLLVEAGLAHRHRHVHDGAGHDHFHVHDVE
jgi:cobalt/nickel transport system ATP-binding protein